MNKSITQNSQNEKQISASLLKFFVRFHVSSALKSANAYKKREIPVIKVFQSHLYADGWYLALPFVDIFDLYNPSDIKKNYLEIIHNAMFAKVSKGNYIAYWFNLIGNIPLLLYKYQIDIQWSKMYKIFNDILDMSLVY